MSAWKKLLLGLGLTWVVGLTVAPARAELSRRGDWPEDERVSLSVHGQSRSEAVRGLAAQAGWSLVASDLGQQPVEVEVKDQPASAVLGLLLADGQFIAERQGQLVSIRPLTASASLPSKDPKAVTPAPALHREPGEDRVVTGEERIGKDEVVGDVIVWRGSVIIEGTVTGSVAVFGGSAQLLGSAYVHEDVVSFGGTLDLSDGVRVDGEVSNVFGTLRRGERVRVRCVTCADEPKQPWAGFAQTFFEKLAGASLLWVVGALLLAIAAPRLEKVRSEMMSRPLRSFGLGLLSLLVLLLSVVTLAVTLIGIPLAVLLALFAVLCGYLSFCAVPLCVGYSLLGRRSDNSYAQLALGCAVLFFVQLVPGIGDLLSTLAAAVAVGALVATRGAGLVPTRSARSDAASA